MSLDCFGGFLNQITTGKKVQSSVHWLQFWIVLAGLSLCFLAGSLIKLLITTGKRYSRLAIGWNVTSKTCLIMVERFAGPSSMAMGNQPMPLRSQGTLFVRGCPRAGCEVFCQLCDLAEKYTPASFLLSKSIRKVSITATCRLEWHYQLSKKNYGI